MGRRGAGRVVAAACVAAATALAQPPWAGGPPGRGGDPSMQQDRRTFHELLARRAAITRSVRDVEGGVETLTESADEAVAATIRRHVHAMHARLRDGRPIHRRDPLFAALFDRADAIRMEITDTPHGVRVRETSDDASVVRLIRAHARVIDRFLAEGWSEVHRDHAVPAP